MERKSRSSQSPRSAAFTTGISGQLDVGSVKLFPINTARMTFSVPTGSVVQAAGIAITNAASKYDTLNEDSVNNICFISPCYLVI
jgi:hypothetical protein